MHTVDLLGELGIAVYSKGGKKVYAPVPLIKAWATIVHLRNTRQVEDIINAFLPVGWECEIRKTKEASNPLQLSIPFPQQP